MLYFSIRVVEAKNAKEAREDVVNYEFVEEHDLCDRILTKRDLLRALKKLEK